MSLSEKNLIEIAKESNFKNGYYPKWWKELLKENWSMIRSNCACGGNWLWTSPSFTGISGERRVQGCVCCHKTKKSIYVNVTPKFYQTKLFNIVKKLKEKGFKEDTKPKAKDSYGMNRYEMYHPSNSAPTVYVHVIYTDHNQIVDITFFQKSSIPLSDLISTDLNNTTSIDQLFFTSSLKK